jgi:hypothetical protein
MGFLFIKFLDMATWRVGTYVKLLKESLEGVKNEEDLVKTSGVLGEEVPK